MKITSIETTALLVPYKKAYHWAQGITHGAEVILVEVHTDEGVTGYGESIATPSSSAVQKLLSEAAKLCIGQDPFANTRLLAEAYQVLFQAQGTCSAPRFAGLVLSGLEMALWDIMGKATGRPVYQMLGGAHREGIDYFGFPQGDTPAELAAHAKNLAEQGCAVIYVKIGRGADLDIEIVRQVRTAIGSRRLRVDANEAWDPLTARRMISKLLPFDIEFVEQPTTHKSLSALANLRAVSPIPIAADQLVFTPEDVLGLCRANAADVIVVGLHETGGINNFRKAAAIAEAAGLNVCIHGLHETGVTTLATLQAAASISNLDDGNQYMLHLLREDIVVTPDLHLINGKLYLPDAPGLGFELDWDSIGRAKALHGKLIG